MGFVAEMGMFTGIASRYIAGITLKEAIVTVRGLNKKGLRVTLDALGENVKTKMDARRARDTYLAILEQIRRHDLDSGISVKLTMLGLDMGDKIAEENLIAVLKKAKAIDRFVRIDMEGSAYTQRTVDMCIRLRKKFSNVGLVLQTSLKRTPKDVALCIKKKIPVRLVKGAYKESEEIAHQRKKDVDLAYRHLIKELLTRGAHTAIATHDEKLIRHAQALIKEHKIPRARYEFQMLFGIRRSRQEELAKNHPTRIYVPYGEDYLPYFYRRIRERKENLAFVLKHMFRD